MKLGDFVKPPNLDTIPQILPGWRGQGLRLCEAVVFSLFRGRQKSLVATWEAALIASSDGCTGLSCCALRPRCGSSGETSSDPP